MLKFANFDKICQNLSKFAKICRNSPKFVKNCQNLSKFAEICQNFPKFIKISQNLSKLLKFCQNCQNFAKFAKIYQNCQNLSKIPKIFKNLLCLKVIAYRFSRSISYLVSRIQSFFHIYTQPLYRPGCARPFGLASLGKNEFSKNLHHTKKFYFDIKKKKSKKLPFLSNMKFPN